MDVVHLESGDEDWNLDKNLIEQPQTLGYVETSQGHSKDCHSNICICMLRLLPSWSGLNLPSWISRPGRSEMDLRNLVENWSRCGSTKFYRTNQMTTRKTLCQDNWRVENNKLFWSGDREEKIPDNDLVKTDLNDKMPGSGASQVTAATSPGLIAINWGDSSPDTWGWVTNLMTLPPGSRRKDYSPVIGGLYSINPVDKVNINSIKSIAGSINTRCTWHQGLLGRQSQQWSNMFLYLGI